MRNVAEGVEAVLVQSSAILLVLVQSLLRDIGQPDEDVLDSLLAQNERLPGRGHVRGAIVVSGGVLKVARNNKPASA